MVHITVLMKTIGLRETQNGPPKMSKNDFLTKTTKNSRLSIIWSAIPDAPSRVYLYIG